MPFTDPVSSISGRNSRSSNISAATASRSTRSQPLSSQPMDTLVNAGVLSMLKTSTDTGDIGALSFNNARLPRMLNARYSKRRHHGSEVSASSNLAAFPSSHHYAPSQTSRVSSTKDWDTTSGTRRGSLTSMQSMPPAPPPPHLAKAPVNFAPRSFERPVDSRSLSLTSATQPHQIPRHRSVTSLQSQDRDARHGPAGYRSGHAPPPPMLESRPLYAYPTRLRRPGYRSPSPALSDSYAQVPSSMSSGPGAQQRPHLSRPPPQTFDSYDSTDYPNDSRHMHVRPPPRAQQTPMRSYGDLLPAQHPFQHPAAMRSAPRLAMPYSGMGRPGQRFRTVLTRPTMDGFASAGTRQLHPNSSGLPVPPHSSYSQYASVQLSYPAVPASHPQPNLAPMAHHMFHNAARMARSLPVRADTPTMELGPPSSDPPSSGTAPTSSSPPTPRDQTTIPVGVDPVFIDPALVDLLDTSSDPTLPIAYLEHAEALDKEVEERDMHSGHPSIPQSGFVARVKAMLEVKAAAETASREENEHGVEPRVERRTCVHDDLTNVDDQAAAIAQRHDAVPATRVTVVEEYDAPVELPASPVRLAELSGSPIQPKRRITREIIKAGLGKVDGPDTTMSQPEDPDTSASIDMIIQRGSTRSEEEERCGHGHEVATPTQIADQSNHEPDTDTAATLGPDESAISGADYALRFSTPPNSPLEDSQTRDPFVLDADTVTLQHQHNKDKVGRYRQQGNGEPEPLTSCGKIDVPVSPILSGEDVGRYSAVSPLQTQTLMIDEALHKAPESPSNDTLESTMNEVTITGTTSEASQPPLTPRTPRCYSKSVQLRPSTALADTPSSDRHSLPPDLSTMGETTTTTTTTTTTSDMVTDIAVRFSLPQTTVTVTKPQIVEIPPSSSPEKPYAQQKLTIQPSFSRSKRASVTFADELVLPLKIDKKPERPVGQQAVLDPCIKQAKSIVRRPSPSLIPADAQYEGMNQSRSGGTGVSDSKFGNTRLPGLKEESIEDISISEKRVTRDSSQFPLPPRIAAIRAMQERRLHETAQRAKARRAGRHQQASLIEIRDLPSLNFSRMDLIDKLNEALKTRTSRSMDIVRRRDLSGIHSPSPQRPQSTEPLRERYLSFFSKPEDFSTFFDLDKESEDEDQDENSIASARGVPAVEIQPNTEDAIEDDQPRPLSPEDLISVATQVSRLPVPSVAGLSERLSGILPNLHDFHLDSVLASFRDGPDGTRRLDGEQRPGTVLSNRTSAGFRTLAERAETIVKNGTHDSHVVGPKALTFDTDVNGLTQSMSAYKVSAIGSTDAKQTYLTGSQSAPSDLRKVPERPAPALTRQKSPRSEEEVQALLPREMNPITRNAKRALITSSSSRPWNQDENYPWAGTKVDVDLTVPSQAHARDSITTNLHFERSKKSNELILSHDGTESNNGIDIGSIVEKDTTKSISSEQYTGVDSYQHLHKQSKHPIIGSLTKKIGLGKIASEGLHIIKTSPSPVAMSDGRTSIPHRPGERYPTSSLTPPAAFTLDEVRSFFSDNSSEKERNASFRKRLTHFKGSKSKSVRLDPAARPLGSLDGANTSYDGGALQRTISATERAGAVSSANMYDGAGLSGRGFSIKRVGDKLRHLVAKGGQLLRSWSLRSKAPTKTDALREDWLSDSLFSGV